MRVLFFTGSPASYMAPPLLGVSQVNCGPDWPDRVVDGKVVSLKSPVGAYDVEPFVKRLPATQRPDVVVCLVDAARRNLPANLRAFRGPKVLLVADTHHLRAPISGMLQYATSEPYDRIIVLYDRHHLEFFRSAGLKNLFWFPGLTFPHSDDQVARARKSWELRSRQIAFVGQTGGLHPRRARLVGALAQAGLPVGAKQIPQREGLEFYGSSAIGLNVSLNGDLNLRVFEILASGAMLLTDQLAPSSGMDQLWSGNQLASYRSEPELLEAAAHYLKHPTEAAAIAKRGVTWLDQLFGEEKRRLAFEHIVFDGVPVPEFVLPPTKVKAWFADAPRQRDSAIKVYERVQELHRQQETVAIAIDAAVSKDAAEMLATLPRVSAASCFSSANDLAVVSGCTLDQVSLSQAARVWVVDAAQSSVAAALSAAGLQPIDREIGLFARDPQEIEEARLLHSACWRHLHAGDYARALELARATLAKDPKDVDALVTMADLALEACNRPLATKLLQTLRGIAPLDPRLQSLTADLTRGSYTPKLPQRLLNTARDLATKRDWKRAGVFVAKALELEPGLRGAYALFGRIHSELGNYQEAADTLLQALKQEDTADAWMGLGHILSKGRQNREAADAFRKALVLAPVAIATIHAVADAAITIGDWKLHSDAVGMLRERDPLAPHSHFHFGHQLKHQRRIHDALRHHCRWCNAPEPRPVSTSSYRVLFVLQHPPFWPSLASVYAAFAADPACEVTVVALPYEHPYYAKPEERDAIYGFLDKLEILYVRADQFRRAAGCADIAFVQSPYEVTRPSGWKISDLLRFAPRLVYVPYALEIGGGEENLSLLFNQPLHQLAWMICARSPRHKTLFAQRCDVGDAHVEVTGHPKMDALRNLETARDAELDAFIGSRKAVLWNPQFDVRPGLSEFGTGFSTFLRWRSYLPEAFARRSEMAFILRPHPLFFASLEKRGVASAAEIADFLRRCEAAGNIHLDRRPSYLPAFAASTALMSDASSFLLEYGATGRPILYLHNPDGPGLNHDGDFVRDYCATATTESEIEAFLDDVAAARDARGAERRAAYHEFMHVPAEGVGQLIKETVEERLAAEHAERTSEAVTVLA
ncbi:glycosyltransferase family protein [Opitutus terrae]|uniref:Tetratricopeptide TPR_2 repeat protein n=1 Tax=Opitutus terrae (strain DSM 11246 / JCM 15787 / PB90-1) TaxID=452637 RepID=B1ZRQ3_OPITP|nr:glycosyltransferase [Opitutus terrae]ACB73746.1 Tetratricopeptide TPR_2 repeat protein [Opitutus terrae PB90-1]